MGEVASGGASNRTRYSNLRSAALQVGISEWKTTIDGMKYATAQAGAGAIKSGATDLRSHSTPSALRILVHDVRCDLLWILRETPNGSREPKI